MAQKTEHDLLNERLANSDNRLDVRTQPQSVEAVEAATPSPNIPKLPKIGFSQWSAEPNDTFRPSGPRRQTLDVGVYEPHHDEFGLYFSKLEILTDNLIELDDSASQRVLNGLRVFWGSRQEYARRGVLYKRGVLLWGPAGSGKTATLTLLTKDLLAHQGLVLLCRSPNLMIAALEIFRRIEPDRNIIVIMEDIDELVQRYGEHEILALLDGENQVQNVVNIATTNYPERLGARIVNRPSRFDERILIDMPNARSREKYIRHITKDEGMTDRLIAEWVRDTEGFNIAHLRELAVAVFCLKQNYHDVVERLSKMRVQPKPIDEFKREPMGLGFGSSRALNSVPSMSPSGTVTRV